MISDEEIKYRSRDEFRLFRQQSVSRFVHVKHGQPNHVAKSGMTSAQ